MSISPEEMARRQAACEHVADLIKTVYAGKPSSKDFQPKRISASSLVSKTAEKIAQELIEAHDAHERGAMPLFKGNYWGFWGDMASERVLEGPEVDVDGAEFWVTHDLGNGWIISAHPDGVKVVDSKYVVLCEQKNYDKVNAKKQIVALRQGALYLAMMRAQWLRSNPVLSQVHFVADLNYERESKPWTWQPHFVPAGVVRSICSPRPPGEAYPQAFADEDLDVHLAQMVEKANHIVLAVENKDLDYARKWDSEHLEEFGVAVEQTTEGQELLGLAAEYVELSQTAEQIDLRKKAIRDRLAQAARLGGNEWSEGGYVVRIQKMTLPGKWNKMLAEKDGVLNKYFTPGQASERVVVNGPEALG